MVLFTTWERKRKKKEEEKEAEGETAREESSRGYLGETAPGGLKNGIHVLQGHLSLPRHIAVGELARLRRQGATEG